MNYITTENVTFVLGILGIAFGVFSYFSKPQQEIETKEAITDTKIVRLEKDVNLILTNHLPHLAVKIGDIHADMSTMRGDIIKLITIIDERIPRK